MRIKNVSYPRPGMDHLLVQAGREYIRFTIGQEKDLNPADAVAVMNKWKNCFELVPDPVPESPVKVTPRKAIPTRDKQIRTAPKDK